MRLGHWWWITWWRHQMETFSALLAIYTGNSPVTGEFPAQRPVARSFDVFFDLRLNKRLRKQSRGWWFETLSRPLWRHCNDTYCFPLDVMNNPCPDLNCGLLKPVKMDEYLYPKVCCGCNYISMSPTHLQFDSVSNMVPRTWHKGVNSHGPILDVANWQWSANLVTQSVILQCSEINCYSLSNLIDSFKI